MLILQSFCTVLMMSYKLSIKMLILSGRNWALIDGRRAPIILVLDVSVQQVSRIDTVPYLGAVCIGHLSTKFNGIICPYLARLVRFNFLALLNLYSRYAGRYAGENWRVI